MRRVRSDFAPEDKENYKAPGMSLKAVGGIV